MSTTLFFSFSVIFLICSKGEDDEKITFLLNRGQKKLLSCSKLVFSLGRKVISSLFCFCFLYGHLFTIKQLRFNEEMNEGGEGNKKGPYWPYTILFKELLTKE